MRILFLFNTLAAVMGRPSFAQEWKTWKIDRADGSVSTPTPFECTVCPCIPPSASSISETSVSANAITSITPKLMSTPENIVQNLTTTSESNTATTTTISPDVPNFTTSSSTTSTTTVVSVNPLSSSITTTKAKTFTSIVSSSSPATSGVTLNISSGIKTTSITQSEMTTSLEATTSTTTTVPVNSVSTTTTTLTSTLGFSSTLTTITTKPTITTTTAATAFEPSSTSTILPMTTTTSYKPTSTSTNPNFEFTSTTTTITTITTTTIATTTTATKSATTTTIATTTTTTTKSATTTIIATTTTTAPTTDISTPITTVLTSTTSTANTSSSLPSCTSLVTDGSFEDVPDNYLNEAAVSAGDWTLTENTFFESAEFGYDTPYGQKLVLFQSNGPMFLTAYQALSDLSGVLTLEYSYYVQSFFSAYDAVCTFTVTFGDQITDINFGDPTAGQVVDFITIETITDEYITRSQAFTPAHPNGNLTFMLDCDSLDPYADNVGLLLDNISLISAGSNTCTTADPNIIATTTTNTTTPVPTTFATSTVTT